MSKSYRVTEATYKKAPKSGKCFIVGSEMTNLGKYSRRSLDAARQGDVDSTRSMLGFMKTSLKLIGLCNGKISKGTEKIQKSVSGILGSLPKKKKSKMTGIIGKINKVDLQITSLALRAGKNCGVPGSILG